MARRLSPAGRQVFHGTRRNLRLVATKSHGRKLRADLGPMCFEYTSKCGPVGLSHQQRKSSPVCLVFWYIVGLPITNCLQTVLQPAQEDIGVSQSTGRFHAEPTCIAEPSQCVA